MNRRKKRFLRRVKRGGFRGRPRAPRPLCSPRAHRRLLHRLHGAARAPASLGALLRRGQLLFTFEETIDRLFPFGRRVSRRKGRPLLALWLHGVLRPEGLRPAPRLRDPRARRGARSLRGVEVRGRVARAGAARLRGGRLRPRAARSARRDLLSLRHGVPGRARRGRLQALRPARRRARRRGADGTRDEPLSRSVILRPLMRPLGTYRAAPALPPELAPLADLARDMRWTWRPPTRSLFRELDPERWQRSGNPVLVLRSVDPARLEALAANADYV